MALADREAVQAVLQQEPTVALAYVFARAGILPGPHQDGLRVGVFWRQPGTTKTLEPEERAARRLQLRQQLAQLLGVAHDAVEIVDLDTAPFSLRQRAASRGLCLKARPEALALRERFEQYARRQSYWRQHPGTRRRPIRRRPSRER